MENGMICNQCKKYKILPIYWSGTSQPQICECGNSNVITSQDRIEFIDFKIELLKKLDIIISLLNK